MSPRTLPDARTAWRIGDPDGEFPIWDDGGARRTAGRWHEAGAGVIYASLSYSTAMLEKLVHYSGDLPRNQHFIEVGIPAGTSYEVLSEAHHPGWSDRGGDVARRFGAAWYDERRSAILIVPSVVARMERNVVFNTAHPDFAGVSVGLEAPVWWDERLFRR
ncbi:RES family NAD+ phosphorylase [Jannaschia rubra]|uniref:RES domain-containing protein n=1 Tax=Jannaschia rubra TaxID=282197 RepID=A0A0M6XWZ6_9RHOB|nr:RES domain-containing protein [Jannaschia rubra]CTQ34833.1 hypothetical protein JAN5088_03629 [Jannaschia rubra]SFG66423.1 RES domain-containing protein [Jannaschia rubra]